MYRIYNTIDKCSLCHSKNCEYVESIGNKFIRCLDCGHEGIKKPIIPILDTSIKFIKKEDLENEY